jgi:hypothetical protein
MYPHPTQSFVELRVCNAAAEGKEKDDKRGGCDSGAAKSNPSACHGCTVAEAGAAFGCMCSVLGAGVCLERAVIFHVRYPTPGPVRCVLIRQACM